VELGLLKLVHAQRLLPIEELLSQAAEIRTVIDHKEKQR